jgi:hypothetical protein
MQTFLEALKGTPWWAFALFAYLLVVGIRSSKTSAISLKRLSILPILFIFGSLYGLIALNGLCLIKIGMWMLAVLLGVGLGWFLTFRIAVKVDRTAGLIHVPGSWLTLILILLIFATKYFAGYAVLHHYTYFYGYLFQTSPAAQESFYLTAIDPVVGGCIGGIFAGRFFCLLNRYRTISKT